MESQDLEKQVEELLAAPPTFEQTANFEQSLKSIFGKEMLLSSAGTALSVNVGNIVGNYLPIGQLPAGTSSILAGILMQKFMGNNASLKKFSEGVIQGGMATVLSTFTTMLPSFSQEKKVEHTEELNPIVEGVMW
jgi:hypothetical protein